MEFERRTQKGRAMAADTVQKEQKRKTKEDVAPQTSSSEQPDGRSAAVVDELLEAQRFSDAMRKAEATAASEAVDTTAGNEKQQSVPPFEAPTHNLSKASEHVQQGDEMAAAFVPLRLAAIRIEGAKNVRQSFLARLCRPYVDAGLRPTSLNRLIYAHRLDQVMPGQPANLPTLLGLLSSLGADVAGLDIFADVTATLQPSQSAPVPSVNGSGEESTSAPSTEDVDVVLTCKDRPRFFLKSSTDVGNGEGNASVQARLRNVFGGAEMADMSATMGTRTRRAFNGSLTWPLFALADHTMSVSAYAQDRDLTSFASATEGVRGGRLSLRFSDVGGPSRGVHELAYDLAHRHLARIQPSASLGIRHLAGHSVKSSVSHTFTRDTRDDNSMATTGSLYKTFVEYAGLGGDAQHVKVDLQSQISRCFGFSRGSQDQFAISLAARAGALTTLNGRSSCFSDRFQLGGPTSVRMFRFNSLGPKDGLDSLGGDAYYSVGTSLVAPLWPGKEHWPLKWHAFVNAGQLVQLKHAGGGPEYGRSIATMLWRNGTLVWDEMLCKPSSSAGVGLMLRQGGLRAEINVGVPLSMRKGDGARKGIQLGIGIDFL